MRKLRNVTTLLFIFLLAGSLLVNQGCRILHPSPQQKTEKKQKEAEKQAMKEYEKARKQHYNNQNKETKHMIKKTKKKADQVNDYKKRSFFSSKKCR